MSTPIRPRAKRRTREEKARDNYESLMRGASEVVGERGYAQATIARIVEKAGLALGTFYQYFESREELFQRLLPEQGTRMLELVGEEVRGAGSFVEAEERSARAIFEYMALSPAAMRIYTEASVFVADAYQVHMKNLVNHYRHFLERAQKEGAFQGLKREQLNVIALTLIAAKTQLFAQYGKGRKGGVPESVIATYVEMVRRLAFPAGQAAATAAGKQPRLELVNSKGGKVASKTKPIGGVK